jgi:hypothetical protein
MRCVRNDIMSGRLIVSGGVQGGAVLEILLGALNERQRGVFRGLRHGQIFSPN